MTKPVKLVTPLPFDQQNKADSVKLLRDALDRAERGEVLGVIIVTKDSDGMWSHHTTATMSIREEIGALECLKWDRIYRSHRNG
ncbi:MAG: hypothetical protein KGJ13_09370 [Patescibacteria group bacterium]|nr:hypothetical protein [Patescibacteria group bacterium]